MSQFEFLQRWIADLRKNPVDNGNASLAKSRIGSARRGDRRGIWRVLALVLVAAADQVSVETQAPDREFGRSVTLAGGRLGCVLFGFRSIEWVFGDEISLSC